MYTKADVVIPLPLRLAYTSSAYSSPLPPVPTFSPGGGYFGLDSLFRPCIKTRSSLYCTNPSQLLCCQSLQLPWLSVHLPLREFASFSLHSLILYVIAFIHLRLICLSVYLRFVSLYELVPHTARPSYKLVPYTNSSLIQTRPPYNSSLIQLVPHTISSLIQTKGDMRLVNGGKESRNDDGCEEDQFSHNIFIFSVIF